MGEGGETMATATAAAAAAARITMMDPSILRLCQLHHLLLPQPHQKLRYYRLPLKRFQTERMSRLPSRYYHG